VLQYIIGEYKNIKKEGNKMIIDNKDEIKNYRGISAALDKGFDFIEQHDFATIETGRYVIDGDNVYATVMSLQSKKRSNAKFEAHQKYIDIQFIYGGTEIMIWQNTSGLTVSQPYDDTKDITFFDENNRGESFKITAGYFVVFFPGDAHMPDICDNMPADVKKVVVKVKY
jgi:YhcH/YjgK/YiaL family protein